MNQPGVFPPHPHNLELHWSPHWGQPFTGWSIY
nr:MAG TPA_asm: hypothetical protein [Caudoviricetes sp.]